MDYDEGEAVEEVEDVAAMPAWRRFAWHVVHHPDFEAIVLVLVLVDCVALALFQPLEPDSAFLNVLMTETGAFLTPRFSPRVRAGSALNRTRLPAVACLCWAYSHSADRC